MEKKFIGVRACFASTTIYFDEIFVRVKMACSSITIGKTVFIGNVAIIDSKLATTEIAGKNYVGLALYR